MEERLEWIDALAARMERAFDDFSAALAAPAALLGHRSASDRWSALEVGEHAALTNRFLLILLSKIAEKCRARVARGVALPPGESDFVALERLSERDFAWNSPEHMLPTGRVAPADVRLELASQRERFLALVREFPRGEGRLHTIRMAVIGPDARVDLYQLACFAALHLERHGRQARRALDEARRLLSDQPDPGNPRAQHG